MSMNNDIKELYNAYQIMNKIKSKPLYVGLLNSNLEEIIFPEYNRVKMDIEIELTDKGIRVFNKNKVEFSEAKNKWGVISYLGFYNTINNNFGWMSVEPLENSWYIDNCSTIAILENNFDIIIPYNRFLCQAINTINLLNYWFE